MLFWGYQTFFVSPWIFIFLLTANKVEWSFECEMDFGSNAEASRNSLNGLNLGMLPPKIIPEKEFLVIQAGDNFSFDCLSSQKHNWSFIPSYNEDVSSEDFHFFNISYEELLDQNYKFYSKLEVSDAHVSDVGYYYCTGEETIDPSQNAEDTAKIYVYINDSETLLASGYDSDSSYIMKTTKEYKETVIPCHPTSPDVNVSLKIENKDVLIQYPYRYTYSPLSGFTLLQTLMDDGDVKYECEAQRGNISQKRTIKLNVREHASYVSAPKIELNAGNYQDYIEVGSNFSLNCSTVMRHGHSFSLKWYLPNKISNNEDHLICLSKSSLGTSTISHYQLLMIQNASINDEGIYECKVIHHSDTENSTKYYIKIHDANKGYINITDSHADVITRKSGEENFQIKVSFKSYPNATVTWMNDTGDNLADYNKHYEVKTTTMYTLLKIKKVLLENAGNYTLLIENSRNESRKIVKTLHVTGKPSKMTVSIAVRQNNVIEAVRKNAVIEEKRNYTLICNFLANPRPSSITWTFKECASYKNCSVKGIEMKNPRSSSNSLKLYDFTSEIDVSTEKAGKVTCIANNQIGKTSATFPFDVTDVNNGFNIVTSSVIFVGYPMMLSCKASVFLYNDSMTWIKDGMILPNKGYELLPSNTKFSYGNDIHVKSLSLNNSGTYECLVYNLLTGTEEKLSYRIDVKEVIEPSFNRNGTNVNKNEITISDKNGNSFELICNVFGDPHPQITWYKDDVPVARIAPKNSSNKFELMNRNQTLLVRFPRDDDEGIYKCRCKNLGGFVESYVNVIVTTGKHRLSKGLSTVIAFLILFLTILLALLFFKMKKEKELKAELTKIGLHHFESGATECINPELGVDEQAELLPYDRKWEFPRDKLKLGKQLGSGAFGVVLKGEAIDIVEGENVSTVAVKMVKQNADSTHIKALASELKIMVHLGQHLNVVNLLGACTKNLMKRELLVIVEYCCYGNLQKFLLRHRHCFIDQIVNDSIDASCGQEAMAYALNQNRQTREGRNRMLNSALSLQSSGSFSSQRSDFRLRFGSISSNPSTYQWDSQQTCTTDASGQSGEDSSSNSQPLWRSNYNGDYKHSYAKPIRTQDLLCWSFQVARGMDYLVSRKVLHGDLAARNILLAEDNVVKICDFGLARSMYQSSNYKKTGDGPLPVKWMAVESIQDRVFSTQSDIWSFGIVLWEFFSLARTPYPGMEADERMFNLLVNGYRMKKPRFATSAIYNVMMDCWNSEPSRRPLFAELGERLGTMLEETVKMHFLNLNNHYLMMNEQHQQSRDSSAEDYLAMMSAPTYCHETARQKTPVKDYINMPASDSATTSNYLAMSSSDSPGSVLTEECGYLRMNINSPSPSVLYNPLHSEADKFQFSSLADRKSADHQQELKPFLQNPSNYLNYVPADQSETNAINESSLQSNLTPNQENKDDGFGDGLISQSTSCFENPCYQVMNRVDVSVKTNNMDDNCNSETDLINLTTMSDELLLKPPPPYEGARI